MSNGKIEQERQEAARRVHAGEPVAAVAEALGRSASWVRKWVDRHDPDDDSWAVSRSRAPHRVANRTDADLEALVVQTRRRLAENPWAQVGPAAIAWELTKRGVEEQPSPRTIARILARHDIDRRPRRDRYEPKGTDYPDPPAADPNDCQQADLVGPRYLVGGDRFYAVNAVDLGRRKAAGAIVTSKSATATCDALTSIWGRLGVPDRLQLDNQQALAGAGRSPGHTVRFCLAHGVTPTFIPYSEPWRNGVVEHFNDTFDKQFFRTETFDSVGRVADRYDQFLDFHNANHRYSALAGRTPDQTENDADFAARPPDPDVVVPDGFAGLSGRVEYIRLIRSDVTLRLLDLAFPMPDHVVYEYVTAVLDIDHQHLDVLHHGARVARFPCPLPT
jgi:hypothetical protein